MPRQLDLGQPAPWFHAAALGGNPQYSFNTAAGRWVVMMFLGSGAADGSREALEVVKRHRHLFDDARACLFGVTVNPDDAASHRIAPAIPGIRWFLDYDRAISLAYGAISEPGAQTYAPHWLLLDPMLRVTDRVALADGEQLMARLRQRLASPMPPIVAPVLVLPNVLSPDLCRHLVGLYEANGGQESGFMREVNGVTTTVHDHGHKRRADFTIGDQQLIKLLKNRLSMVLAPMIQRVFQSDVTRIERFIVACYDAEEGGHFRAHRDNTTAGTAHRKFACTINLNADSYEGGDLSFPEFGGATYRAPTGGAVLFSCSVLHEARPVTRGRRYAFLPFLYDEEGARIREQNLGRVDPELRGYKSGLDVDEPAIATG